MGRQLTDNQRATLIHMGGLLIFKAYRNWQGWDETEHKSWNHETEFNQELTDAERDLWMLQAEALLDGMLEYGVIQINHKKIKV